MGCGSSSEEHFDYAEALRGDTATYSCIVDKTESSVTFRSLRSRDKLSTLLFEDEPEINDIGRTFGRAVEKFGDLPFLGERIYYDDGSWGEYEYNTYAETADRVGAFVAGLNAKCPWLKAPTKPFLENRLKGGKIGVYSKNSRAWVETFLGAMNLGLACVPVYDSLGSNAVHYITNHAELDVVFVSSDNFPKLQKALEECPQVKTVVVFPSPTPVPKDGAVESKTAEGARDPGVPATPEGVNYEVISYNDLLEIGKGSKYPPSSASPEMLTHIMYTSGTTGDPKGVLLTHSCFISGAGGMIERVHPKLGEECHLSFLPLAHSFEGLIMMIHMACGSKIAFFHGDVRKLTEDMCLAKPTIFCGVPRVYQRIQQVVEKGMSQRFWLVRKIIEKAVREQTAAVREGRRIKKHDDKIFSKVAEKLGGRIHIFATGSAPIAPSLKEFLEVMFMGKVMEGYGLTETLTSGTITCKPSSIHRLHAGSPVDNAEIRLVSVPDMDYLVSDEPCPRGEIQIRGPSVCAGYYKSPKKTAEAFTEDGWFLTGDIGRLNGNGTLSIIDRKKNLFKLSQGEYIAVEVVEMAYMRCPLVGQVWVYGDSLKNSIVAIVVPDPTEMIPAMLKAGIPGVLPMTDPEWKAAFAAAVQTPAANGLVMAAMDVTAKEQNLRRFEWAKAVYLEGEVNDLNMGFTPDNDCMTPTFKLRRPFLRKRYQKMIDNMYEVLGE